MRWVRPSILDIGTPFEREETSLGVLAGKHGIASTEMRCPLMELEIGVLDPEGSGSGSSMPNLDAARAFLRDKPEAGSSLPPHDSTEHCQPY